MTLIQVLVDLLFFKQCTLAAYVRFCKSEYFLANISSFVHMQTFIVDSPFYK